jgi:hypothetical protein
MKRIKQYLEYLGASSSTIDGSNTEILKLSLDMYMDSIPLLIVDSKLLETVETGYSFMTLAIHDFSKDSAQIMMESNTRKVHLYQPVGPFELLSALKIMLQNFSERSATERESFIKRSASKSISS